MGEVRAQAKLTNYLDDALARRGERLREQVRTYDADALVDTGAMRCVLPLFVMQRLGLEAIGRTTVRYADGRFEEVDITEVFWVEVMGRSTAEEALVLGDQVLIGQTALEKMDLLVDPGGRRLIPNPAHPDQPVSPVVTPFSR